MIGLSLGLVLSGSHVYWGFLRQQQEHTDFNERVLELIAPTATRAIETSDNELASEAVLGIMKYEFIQSANIIDVSGNVLADQRRYNRQKEQFLWLTELIDKHFQQYSAELFSSDEQKVLIGHVNFVVNLNSVYDQLYRDSFGYLLAEIVKILILVSLLFVFLYFYMARPLSRLVNEMQTINFYQPKSQRFTPLGDRKDELSQLVESGNELLESVELALDSQRSIEGALRKSEEHLRQLIDRLPVYVSARNSEGRVVFANNAWASVFGLSPEQIRFNRLVDIASDAQDNILEVLGHDRVVFKEDRDVFVAEESWLSVEGRELFWQSHYTPLKFHDESVVLVVSTDISDRKKNEADIAYMAYHDPLTGLPNRLQLVERLENELHRAARHKYFGAVLFIDLDQFKYINDSLGHPVGDVVLKEVAHRLENSVREEDLVARLGGDEFVLVLTVLDTKFSESVKKASEIINKVRTELGAPIAQDNMDLRVTCSVGAVMFPDGNVTVHELLRFADTAMYQVKEGGRNGIAFFNEAMAEQAKNQLVLEAELHKALSADQYELFYQAKVDVQTGMLTGAEALLRWKHPERGYISPGIFISVLESSGMIIEVGQWILEEACRSLQKWQALGVWNDDMHLSINISPRQFRRSDFVNEVKKTLMDIPVHRGTLDIEITESVVIGNIEETISTMEELALEGISFSLDDFGTGYSSISYLKRLPVSTLKIDQSFIRDLGEDRSDKVLVESMSSMGRLLGLKVVAEGVEEQEQLELIRDFGCDEYQGYFFSRPIPADQFYKLLHENSLKQSLKASRVG